MLGSERGMGALGAVGARDGSVVVGDALEYNDGRKGGFDPHARIPDMNLDGIDAAYLYPSIGLFAGSVEDPRLSAAICRAYNRRLADYCKPYPDRLFGIAMLPMQDIGLAIKEMHFARRDLGMPGIFLRPNPYNNKMVHHPDYDRFWSAVEDCGCHAAAWNETAIPSQINGIDVAAKMRKCCLERELASFAAVELRISRLHVAATLAQARAGPGYRDPPGRRIWPPRILIYCRIIEKPQAPLSHSKRQYRHEPALFFIQAAT
jgi:hypothetical protein